MFDSELHLQWPVTHHVLITVSKKEEEEEIGQINKKHMKHAALSFTCRLVLVICAAEL